MALSKCPHCGFDDIVEKNVDRVLRGGNDTAVITVLAQVCLHCGEQIYDSETFLRFGRIRKKLASGQVEDFQPVGRYFRVPESYWDREPVDLKQFLAELSDSYPARTDGSA